MLLIGQRARISKPSNNVMTLESATQIHGISAFMLDARMIRMMPDATSEAPSMSVSNTAANTGLSKVTNPKQEFAPAIHLECVDHLCDAGDDHHDSETLATVAITMLPSATKPAMI
jgi:hypothetical protein